MRVSGKIKSKKTTEEEAENKIFNDMCTLPNQKIFKRNMLPCNTETWLGGEEENHAHPHEDRKNIAIEYRHIPDEPL
jgi:hypothetical protein